MSGQSLAAQREALFGADERQPQEFEDNERSSSVKIGQLSLARSELKAELDRMRTTAAVVSETSSTISLINAQYQSYHSRILSAAKTLKTLRSKMVNDERYIYWSYVIFMLSAAWIFLKRVKVIAISEWLVAMGIRGLGYISPVVKNEMISSPSSLPSDARPPSSALVASSQSVIPNIVSTDGAIPSESPEFNPPLTKVMDVSTEVKGSLIDHNPEL
jgi:hypothetical protein